MAAVFLIIVPMAGCTTKFVLHVDGYPSPEEVQMMWTHDGSIAAKWFFSRWFAKKIESRGFSEEIEFPEHLSFDQRNLLPRDTRQVVVNLQVYNPRWSKYRLVKCSSVDDLVIEEPVAGWTIREVQNVVVAGPAIPGKEVKLSVKLITEGSEGLSDQVISTGELQYVIEPP